MVSEITIVAIVFIVVLCPPRVRQNTGSWEFYRFRADDVVAHIGASIPWKKVIFLAT